MPIENYDISKLTVNSVPREEQETTVSYGRMDDRATVYTSDNTVLTKIQKLLNAPGSTWKLEKIFTWQDGTPSGFQFSCPKKMVRLVAKTHKMSDEQKEAFKARMSSLGGEPEEDDDETE